MLAGSLLLAFLPVQSIATVVEGVDVLVPVTHQHFGTGLGQQEGQRDLIHVLQGGNNTAECNSISSVQKGTKPNCRPCNTPGAFHFGQPSPPSY